jgi:hypothetical protein
MGKIKLILIFLVFIAPFLFAQYFYMTNATDSRGTTNHGNFLDEEINIKSNLNNQDEYWVLLQVLPSDCNLKCQDNTHMLRQVNTSLGKDMDRVQRHILFNESYVDKYKYLNNYPKVVVLDSSETLYNKLSIMEDGIFIVDPFGKIILGYDQNFEAKGLLKDLKKLLKYSKI